MLLSVWPSNCHRISSRNRIDRAGPRVEPEWRIVRTGESEDIANSRAAETANSKIYVRLRQVTNSQLYRENE